MFSELGKPPGDLSPTGALTELCGSSYGYDDGPDTSRVSYDETKVSWPPEGSAPIQVADLLTGADHGMLYGWRFKLLAPAADFERLRDQSEIKQPFLDSKLTRSGARYAKFLLELQARELVRFKRGRDTVHVGIFFVRKKCGGQRIILDTRIANLLFVPPHIQTSRRPPRGLA